MSATRPPHPSAPAPFAPDTALPCAVVPAVNVEARRGSVRPSLLILHYTGMSSAAKAVEWLACAQSRVSCHYVIGNDGLITQLVPESQRAWHAGVSQWGGNTDINSASIGIEIQNPGHEHGYPDFSPAQMAGVAALSRDIIARHALSPQSVLAHSDVAPARKIDPGEKFDWRWLYTQGVGHWIEPEPLDPNDPGFEPGYHGPDILAAQTLLRAYGYGLEPTGTLDPQTAHILRAFQLHFRPALITSRLDRSTLVTLERLVAALPTA